MEARIRPIALEEAEGDVALFYEAATRMLGRVPTSLRVHAHTPHVAKLLLPFTVAIQRDGVGSVLSCRIKEMAVIKTSKVNGCDYCVAHNTALGQAAGITDEQVEAIGSDAYMDSPHLTPREKAAVLWAEHVTRNTARHRDDVFEKVRAQFTDPELVELTFIIAKFNMSNRFQDSLRLPIEERREVDRIRRTVRADPAAVKAYLQALIDSWPESFPEPAP